MAAGAGGDGFLATLRRLGGSLAELLQVRLELLGTELEQEKRRVLEGLLLAAAGLLLTGVASVLAAVLVLLLFWEQRLVAAAALLLGFGLGGALLLRAARRRWRSPGSAFAVTRAELARDREALAGRGGGPR